MTHGLIALLITVVVVGIILYFLLMLLDRLPMDAGFKQMAKVLLILICVLIVLFKALPLIDIYV